jgi:methyl-accepting chemotaxis protein
LENISKGITEIAKANSESAEGTHNIAQNVTVVVKSANEITAMVDYTRESSDKLMGMVEKFKV